MEVVASAPGKVLITGGYLVLERPNAGVVLSTTARFYAIVRPFHSEVQPDSWAWSWTDVKVISPQLSRESTYKLSLKNLNLELTSSRDTTNPFVEQAIQFAVAASKASFFDQAKKAELDKLLLQGLHITILGSNDFYSYRNQIIAHGLPLSPEVLASLPPFSPITSNSKVANGTCSGADHKPEVAKTGLGSSAAMTTSVVAAVMHYLGAVNLQPVEQVPSGHRASGRDLDLVHAVAQAAHCIAQGKIGSGFDVSAAVYGSHRYVRFSPEIISSAQGIRGINSQDIIAEVLTTKWDHERTQFSLPPLMTLLLGEPGTGGSSTPSMVGSIKQWQKSDPHKSQETWRNLAASNSKLELHFKNLSQSAKDNWKAYESILRSCSCLPHAKWMEWASDPNQESIVKLLLAARDAFLDIRFHMREMGKAAGVPIEPDSQTRLLDATMDLEGVLLAGVPGAGGFDAVFAVILEPVSESLIKTWSSCGVLPLLVKEDPNGVSLETGDPRAKEVSSAISLIQIN